LADGGSRTVQCLKPAKRKASLSLKLSATS
jgi:hypothetical protein